MIFLFKHYTTLCGLVEIEANNEKEAKDKFQSLKISDLKWKSEPSGKTRTTYEVLCEDFTNKNLYRK